MLSSVDSAALHATRESGAGRGAYPSLRLFGLGGGFGRGGLCGLNLVAGEIADQRDGAFVRDGGVAS
jgi:hypothetical protein